ncbi:hypothetical protein AB1K54_15355 [Microbacterium sp. BWT-B31]|uniref:hypothetical protein n=1 Tax=Microbacterium sp. BWT-B31 TaxID=3232072 RepID=UPI003528D31B
MEQTMIARADRVTMRVIGALAAAMACALAAGQLIAAATYAWADSVTLSLLAEQQLPVEPGLGVTTASVDTVSVTTSALSTGARWSLAGGGLLLAATALLVGLAVVWLMLAAASGRPFRSPLFRVTLIAAFALVLGPLLATALSGFGAMQAAFELNDAVGGILVPGFGVSPWGLTIPVVSLGLIALAYLFQRMQRLQRDTEGLV